MTPARHRRAYAAGAALVVAEVAVRLVVGEPYLGSTVLLVLACGIAASPFLPDELARLSLRLAVVPALGLVAFVSLLTTVSVAGVRLGEVSIRLAVLGLLGLLGVLAHLLRGRGVELLPPPERPAALEGAILVGLAGVLAFALASAWDAVGPFPPPGVDWGHYLLYADEVEAQNRLLLEDAFAGEEGRLFADSPGVGALYGSLRIVDGVPSSWLAYGLVVVSALSPLSVFAATGALWGARAGLLGAAAWAVAPVHVEPIRWHGLGTSLALVFVPLVVLALGLLYRGRRGWRVVGLLAPPSSASP